MKKLVLIGILLVMMLFMSASIALADQVRLTNRIYIPIVYSLGNQLDVKILPNHTHFVDDASKLHVIGEIQNNTAYNLLGINFFTSFYDAQGVLLENKYSFTNLDTLPAHEKTCFDVVLTAPANWSYYKFGPLAFDINPDPLPKLSLLNVSAGYDSSTGNYSLAGDVKNDGAVTMNFVFAVGSIYNATGNIVGCEFSYVADNNLIPKEQSPFQMVFEGRDYADVTSYRVQADGVPEN